MHPATTFSPEAAGVPISPSVVGALLVFAAIGVLLLSAGGGDYPFLHTVLDSGMFLLSGILALLLWETGARLGSRLPRWIAVSFAVTFMLELLHVLVGVEWSGAFAPITRTADVLRPATWAPAAHLLPIGLMGSLWLLRHGKQRVRGFAVLLSVVGGGMLAGFYWLPSYTPPTWFGITRPTLLLVPILWAMAGVGCWRFRAADRVLPLLAASAPVFVLAHLSMLYSRSLHDSEAMVAHLGKVGGYLSLLLSLMMMASLDTLARIRSDRKLAELNEGLERRVEQRTAELGAANQSLETEVGARRQTEEKVKAQIERMNLLHQITRAIGERQDLKSIFQVVVRSLEDKLPVDFSCVCLYDQLADVLIVTSVGLGSEALALELALTDEARVRIDENGLSRCVRGDLVYEPEIGQSAFPFSERLARGGLRSMVAAPLRAESRVFGVLIAARRQPHSFSSGECEFLRQLSEHAALAAHQAQLHASLLAAYEDLRQTQQAVLQQERLHAVGQMASGIAHDINNAISPVMLYADSLLEQESALSASGREDLEIIRRAVEDVAQTVARMGEFYRPRSAELSLAPVQVNRLIGQVTDLTRARWSDMPQQRGVVIHLRTDLAPELPAVAGVESEIREALINLLFNAVDAMPEGGVLTLRTRVVDETVEVEVGDTGAGMTEETRRRCLEPFFTTKGDRGTGLGLAMVYGVAQRHNAELDLSSALGGGTIVRISFPIPKVAIELAGEAAVPEPLPGLHILIVDDDPMILKSLHDILQADGHTVASANGGQQGIDALRMAVDRGEEYSVVITDLGMPYIDGRRVASEVKRLSPATPVILLTGWGQRLKTEGDLPPQVDRVLAKPPKLRELREALAYCVILRSSFAGSVP